MRKNFILAVIIFTTLYVLTSEAFSQDGQAVVEASFDYFRGKTSIALVDMTIHRPDWERTMRIKAWTKGQDESLVRIISPPKDEGNGTLKKGKAMWMYNPKVNRIIKVPPSMMSQSWMGSDFSNNDLAKSDSIIKDYVHTITGMDTHEGMKVYLIKSMPKPEAPVVWGMQRLKVREDHIFLEQSFYDEDLKLVKEMTAHAIKMLGGRPFPSVWKMRKAEAEEEYTLLEYRELAFDISLPATTFTNSALRTLAR
jgi:outer membrane lipoprotein-sorting protein